MHFVHFVTLNFSKKLNKMESQWCNIGTVKQRRQNNMEEIIYYKAKDGQIFDDENECLQYERKVETKELSGMYFFDMCFHPIKYTDFEKLTTDVYIENAKNAKTLQSIAECSDDSFPTEEGYWYWNREFSIWENLREKIEFYTVRAETLKQKVGKQK